MDLMQSLIASKLLGGGGGSEPILKTKSVYENGTYSAIEDEADGYSSVTVDVPKNVTSRGLTVNGTFSSAVDNKDGYSNITVNVQEAPVKTTSLTVTENGIYEPGPTSEISLTIPTIPDEVETDVPAGYTLTNFDNLRVEFINKTTGTTGHVDVYPSAIAVQTIPMSFKDRTLIAGPDGDHYITIVNGYDSIIVLQKGYTITTMKLTSYSGYFDEVNVNVSQTPHLAARTIQNNGFFRSDVDGLDGYNNVVVNVADNTPNYEQLTVTQNGVYIPSSSDIETFGLADGIPEEVETEVYAAGSVTRKDNLTINCYDKVSHTGVTGTINTSSIVNKATPQSLREKTLIICEDADHYVYLTKTNESLWIIQKGYTFDGHSFELKDNASAFNMVNVNLPDGTNTEY